MSAGGSGDSPKVLRGVTVAELFDRLEVLGVLLSENGDRWALSSRSATTARILDERFELHRERDDIERELRRRTARKARDDVVAFDEERHADVLDRAAARHDEEVLVHELAASFFDQHGLPRPAARQRQQAEGIARLAAEERAEAARLRETSGR